MDKNKARSSQAHGKPALNSDYEEQCWHPTLEEGGKFIIYNLFIYNGLYRAASGFGGSAN